jgi:serine/threonine protein phosphatase PrpC
MTICPKCNAENRAEAAFCSRCGSILLAQPASTKSLPSEPVSNEALPTEQNVPKLQSHEPIAPGLLTSGLFSPDTVTPESVPLETTSPEPVIPDFTPAVAGSAQSGEQSVQLPGFAPQPEGSIFGERFRYNSLVYQSEHENQYSVLEICQPSAPWVTICSNPDCRTIHTPSGEEQEKFCTRCGHAMDQIPPMLSLQEADSDRFGDMKQLIDLHLAHPNIHPPIATFQQELPGGMRYCLVTPYSGELPIRPETSTALEWGLNLAECLDYLHTYGVAFGEELDPSSFGMVEDKIVWRNFSNARVLPLLSDREKINNVRLLALNLYAWITGNSTYSVDSALNPSLNRLFQQALVGEGFNSGAKLAHQISLTIKAGLSPLNLDYHVGKRTHQGKKREGNEDSLLCLNISSVQQGLSQPVGLFVIADGMGGHARGDLASSLTVQTILQKATSELTSFNKFSKEEYISWLKQTVQAANQAVYGARKKEDSDMGSTLVCAFLIGNHAYLAHLGDSRVYLLRDKSIHQLSIDHSLVQQLVSNGQISPDEARLHPQRNVILRCLGEKPKVEVDVYTQDLMPGDRLLLCSDGLSGMLDDRQIQIITQQSPSPQIACDYLVDSANLAGGFDNISIILVEVILA